jgi:hypothetical protein
LDRLWLNLVVRSDARAGAPATGETADGTHRHVMIAGNLAAQADAGQPSRREDSLFGGRHSIRLTCYEFHPTSRAAGVTTAGMELIDFGFILQGQNHPFAIRNFKLTNTFHGQFGHFYSLSV